jgi:toxin FitB
MIVLDTNVLSALMREDADLQVQSWLNRQPVLSVWTTSITVYEVRFGLELLPPGRRKQMLETAFRQVLAEEINQQILPFDNAAAEHAAVLDARRQKRGHRVGARDTLIAGIVLAQRATLVTRNVKHFADLDVKIVDPWAGN